MDPSSLIFVVIVAIWAAYLLGHWVRRRDQVATARSVDRFSEAMRVLERRPAVRSVPLSRPNPRSYVVAPAQQAVPTVTVKRAAAVTRPDAARPARPAKPPQSPRPAPAGVAADRRPSADRPCVRRPGRRARQMRGLALLGLLVATPVSWLLAAAASAVTWWMAALVTLALLGVVAELRRSARRARVTARRRETRQRRNATATRRATRRQVVGQLVATRRGAPPAAAAGAEPVPSAGTEPPVTAEVARAVPDDGWQPVPVPPPTYTLKPKAPPVPARPVAGPPADRSAAATAEPSPAQPTAVPVRASEPAFDLDEILERRIAAGG